MDLSPRQHRDALISRIVGLIEGLAINQWNLQQKVYGQIIPIMTGLLDRVEALEEQQTDEQHTPVNQAQNPHSHTQKLEADHQSLRYYADRQMQLLKRFLHVVTYILDLLNGLGQVVEHLTRHAQRQLEAESIRGVLLEFATRVQELDVSAGEVSRAVNDLVSQFEQVTRPADSPELDRES